MSKTDSTRRHTGLGWPCWVLLLTLFFSSAASAQKKPKLKPAQKPKATKPQPAQKKQPAQKTQPARKPYAPQPQQILVQRLGAHRPAPVPQAQTAQPTQATQQQRTFTDKPRLREQWFYEQRAFPHKQIPPGIRQKAVQRLEEMRRAEREGRVGVLPGEAGVAQPTWTSIGPQPSDSGSGPNDFGNTSGRVSAIAVDPTDANIVYLGGAQGGVWKTTNGGTNWTPLTDFEASLAIGSIAIDPTSCSPAPCKTVYVGTGEQVFSGDAYYGAGILKTTNADAATPTWIQLGQSTFVGPFSPTFAPGGGARIGSLAISPMAGPNGPAIVLAGVQINTGTNLPGALTPGLFCSDDGGMNWNIIPAVSGAVATEVLYANATTAYVALGRPFGPTADTENGIYRSMNANAACAAQVWSKILGIPATEGMVQQARMGRIELAVAPSAPTTLFASIADAEVFSDNLLGVFRTTDGGTTWTNMNAPNYCAGQCWYDHVIRVHPNNAGVVYAGGAAPSFTAGGYFVRNTNALAASPQAADWVGVAVGGGQRIHVDIHALAFGFTGMQAVRLYNGNDGGIWSTDVSNPTGAINWSNLNANLSLTQHYPAISTHPSSENVAIAGSQDNDTHRYSGALAWQQIGPGCDGGWTVIDPAIPSTWFITCQTIAIFRSFQNGTGFQFVAFDIDFTDPVAFIAPFVVDPSQPVRLYFGTSRIWRTTNSGDSWTAISPDLTGGFGTIRTIAVAPSDSNIVYAGTSNGLIQRTTNATSGSGAIWEDMTRPELPVRFVTQVAIDPTNTNVVYATFSGFRTCPSGCDGKGHVFKTINGGINWLDVSSIGPGALPDTPVNDIVVDPDDPLGNTLYIGTDVGVFFTTDGGLNWATLVTGLPRVAVFSLKLHPASRILRAATHGRGVWDLQLQDARTYFLRSISPVTAAAGSADVTMTLAGAGFGAGSMVQFGAMQFTPSATAPTQLTVLIPAAQLASASVPQVSVFDAGQTPNTTNSLPFTVTGAAPTLTNISPANAPQGSGDTEITATGTNFVSGNSFLRFDGTDIAATVDSPTQLRATVPASMLTTGGFFPVSVFNMPPGGGVTTSLNFTVVGPPPPNDNFANAIVISGNTFTDTQNNVGATTETNDPNPGSQAACPGAGRNFSIWYRFTPSSNGLAVVTTFGTNYDTVLSVWTGAALGSLTGVACDDDGIAPGGASVLFVNLNAGTTYHFMITGFGPTDAGSTTFSFFFSPPPPNDNFFNATVAGMVPFMDTSMAFSLAATTEATDPTPPCTVGAPSLVNNGRAKSVWYRYTASAAGMVTADTFNSVYDTILSVWTGSPGALMAVACNDDANANTLESQVNFAATANTTYNFMVTDFDGFGGPTAFNITAAPAPGPDISVGAAPSKVTVARGSSGTSMISIAGFSGFAGSVTLSCSGLPTAATCSFNPASVTPGMNPATSTVTFTAALGSSAAGSSIPPAAPRAPWTLLWLGAGLSLVLCFAVWRQSKRLRLAGGLAVLLVLLLAGLQVACGGGGGAPPPPPPPPPNPGTPPGTSSITVTGTSGTLTRSTTVTLVVN